MWDKIVLEVYHWYKKVFNEEASYQFLPKRPQDHAVDLKPRAPNTLDCKIYPLNREELIAQKAWVDEHLKKGYIHESKSKYTFPFFYVKKKDGKLHPIIDYRNLNQWTQWNTYPIPLIDELIDRLTSKPNELAELFMKLDVCWGYHNIQIKEGDQWKGAFKTNQGSFKPLVMLFGMTNAPATFQAMMNCIFRNLINEGYITIYLDDILIHTPDNPEQHE